jgi:hypothetical protein
MCIKGQKPYYNLSIKKVGGGEGNPLWLPCPVTHPKYGEYRYIAEYAFPACFDENLIQLKKETGTYRN